MGTQQSKPPTPVTPPTRLHRLSVPVPVARLQESFRFDQELATALTRSQYQADGIDLTTNTARPLPPVESPTAGVDAVFDAASSLVFVCYDDRSHRTVNPLETTLIETLTTTVAGQSPASTTQPNTTEPATATAGALGEGPQAATEPAASTSTSPPADTADPDTGQSPPETSEGAPSVGVVTPHNAQRGAFDSVLPDSVTANTVDKYQGGERDVIAVSATVSDPQFAWKEDQFILNPRRLLVAISRSKSLTVVVCSTALFEGAPEDSDRLEDNLM